MLNGTMYSRFSRWVKRNTTIASALKDEAPDDAEGVGLAQNDDVAHAADDDEQLHPRDEVQQPIRRAELGVRPQKPVGQHAVLGDAVEHAVGADDGVLTAPARMRKPTPTTKVSSTSFKPGGPRTCRARPPMRFAAVKLHADFVGMRITARKLMPAVSTGCRRRR